jgi:acyl-coenzyme A synthetase/AMP-(fatty) acid ligase
VQPGIIPENEQAEGRRLCAELEDEVARGAPRTHGIQRGERVGLLLLMIAEAAISLLAAAKIGAVTLPT